MTPCNSLCMHLRMSQRNYFGNHKNKHVHSLLYNLGSNPNHNRSRYFPLQSS